MDFQSIPAEFPLQGIDVSTPFDQQPPKTTATGINVRAQDAILLRARGGSRCGLEKYGPQLPGGGSDRVQSLGLLIVLREDNTLAAFQDYQPSYVPDPRNSARLIPPQGSGVTPQLNWPPAGVAAYRRQQLTASASSIIDGQTLTLTGVTTKQTGGAFVASGLVTLSTYPPGRAGDGATATTNGSGVSVFTVSEPDFEGPITYFASNVYVRSGQTYESVARGIVTVEWKPDYTLSVTSPDGTSLDADGKPHPLLVALVNTTTGAAVSGRSVDIQTSPSGEAGDGLVVFTNADGEAVVVVSESSPVSVVYTASVLPTRSIQDSVTIDWGLETVWGWTGTASGIKVAGVDMVAVAFNIVTSPGFNPVVGATVTMGTTPTGKVGDNHVFALTDAGGFTDTFSWTEPTLGKVVYYVKSVNAISNPDPGPFVVPPQYTWT